MNPKKKAAVQATKGKKVEAKDLPVKKDPKGGIPEFKATPEILKLR